MDIMVLDRLTNIIAGIAENEQKSDMGSVCVVIKHQSEEVKIMIIIQGQ